MSVYPSFSDPLEDKPDVLKVEVSRPLTEDGKWLKVPNPLPWSAWQQILARCYAHISMLDAAGGMIIEQAA